MSYSGNFRAWMDEPMMDSESNLVKDEYARGICEFMEVAGKQLGAKRSRKLLCPCSFCRNSHNVKTELVWSHLFMNGFMSGYKIWYLHGETNYEYGSSSEPYVADSLGEHRTEVDFGVRTVEMVNDAFRQNISSAAVEEDRCEEPNLEARRFFDMLDAAKQPLYKGCKEGHSPLSSASRLMTIKTDHNLSEECVDAITDWAKDLLPEDNLLPASYYEVQKLVAGLGLPYQVIDVCIDNSVCYTGEKMKTAEVVDFVGNRVIRKLVEEFQFHINGCGIYR
ncbi:hypothetical protein V5N11_014563 [Cardamine amara subsp. amara]|uniref:Transposase-associated domain-containing protein n=1 Tax=Cardamine amara subsp. amara TaxID=228776 RepID=A0ABD1BIU7_CARAN